MAVDLQVLEAQLKAWAAAHYDPGASVRDVETMPGHAGLSFGFTVVHADGEESLVMRVPPKGVRRKGNTDVIRQVPLLQALQRAGLPVAQVRWWSEDEQWFEVPFFMVERLPGTTFASRGATGPAPDPIVVAGVFEQAIDALVAIHKFDWRKELDGWEEIRPLSDEIAYWRPILDKAGASDLIPKDWMALGTEVGDLLLAQLPADPPLGLFHGDYQTANLLFRFGGPGVRPELLAVIDWEISGLGGQRLDLGWFLMMNDPASWAGGAFVGGGPDLDVLADRYQEGLGERVADVNWYRAMSGYRFGVISCLNVKLHRAGQRHDPEWERIAESVPALFGRAAELLRSGSR